MPILASLCAGLVLWACGGPDLPAESVANRSITSCDQVPRISAPASAYADSPMYVANEMPIDEVRAWAEGRPAYETIWIDRDHNGWITVAFSADADARQSELEEEFPSVGVVAVETTWTLAELLALQERIGTELGDVLGEFSTGTYDDRGVVGIYVGVLTAEVRSEVESRFGDQPVCLDGRDPASVPAPGPQPEGGEGWRLLVNEPQVGQPYRTGIATDQSGLETLWATIGLSDPLPAVDFETEVVIWFGAVFGVSCPDIRLDDVVVDGPLIHALIVLPNPPSGCTDDANPQAFVVAVERSRLPAGPFAIQLDANPPPLGVPEERTLVRVGLSAPGAVANPDQIGPDPELFERTSILRSGDFLEDGFPTLYEFNVHCGSEWLGELNGYAWRTDETMPAEWQTLIEEGETIDVSLLLSTDPEPDIAATAGAVTVHYRPTNEPLPGCD